MVQIAAGWSTSAAVDEEGQAWIWGCNNNGQLTEACATGFSPTPIKIPGFSKADGVTVKQISLGGDHTALVDSDGMLWTWGSDDYGRLGHGMKLDILGTKLATPTKVGYFAGDEGSGREEPLKVKQVRTLSPQVPCD